jgi:xanthine dehydrogenase YagS FAD-binding subunit
MKIDEDIGVDDEGDAPGSGCSAIGGHNRMHAILGTSDASPVRPSETKVALAPQETDAKVNCDSRA